jgi:endonuclease/exonuclease/phosphatase (EEP) superfamily protein YafD
VNRTGAWVTTRLVTLARASNADMITLQELNLRVAEAIQRDLAREYPYQVLDPQESVTGMSVISRYPLSPTGQTLPGAWVGTPQRIDHVLHSHHWQATSAWIGPWDGRHTRPRA